MNQPIHHSKNSDYFVPAEKNPGCVIAVDLGGTKMYAASVGIGGAILQEASLEQHGSTGEESYGLLVRLMMQILRDVTDAAPVRGIVIGAPGIVQNETGVVDWAPSLNWRDFPLKERLQNNFLLPCFVENDVNLAALGEHRFGAGRGRNHLMLIALGTGVGGALILNGNLYRGFRGASGEIGYFCSSTADLGQRYDQFGAFEQRVSGSGIKDHAVKRLAALGQPVGEMDAKKVFEAAARSETWAHDLLMETADHLSLAVANINALLDLELIVFSGGVAGSLDVLLDGIKERVSGVIPHLPEMCISKLGRRAAVMGAVDLILRAAGNPAQR